MNWSDAVREIPEGLTLEVEVVPGASQDVFPAGYNVWRKRIQARVRAAATGGEANQSLVELIARFFDVPTGNVWIEHGQRNRQKRVGVSGVTLANGLERLAQAPR